ncbi:hypothetical protein PSC71_14605 [Devosia sp. J2-20]|uniref:hypothetical protein n=1 Tax=Devosia sp. J2-20 TaxID=3026161 RepID=UPI00249A06D3|nr:hypothetical protein [Devosia sp. J2-20]WDQ98439.1 hypothetical protein PSC71_14605 [Devosia sp. J2-20]
MSSTRATFGKRNAAPILQSQASAPHRTGMVTWAFGGLAALLVAAGFFVFQSSPSSNSKLPSNAADNVTWLEESAKLLKGRSFDAAETADIMAESFAKAFVGIAERHPEDARNHLVAGLHQCLPPQARVNWTTAPVKQLAADVVLKSFALISEGMDNSEKNRVFRDWVFQAESERLNSSESAQFRGLMRSGLYEGSTMVCAVLNGVNG